MRKIIMGVVLFFVVLFGAFSGDIVGFEGTLEAGIANGAFGDWTDENSDGYLDDYMFTEFETVYVMTGGYVWLWGHVYVGGEMTVQMEQNRALLEAGTGYNEVLPNYNPKFINYRFEAGVTFFDCVTLFISHDCTHPQNTNQYAYRVTALWGEGSIDRVGIRFDADFGAVGSR
jgi:hypothetical protein